VYLTGHSGDLLRRLLCFAVSLAGLTLACLASSAQAEPLTLLDSRGWEMVSPVEKNGGEVQGFGANFGGDVLQAALDGESATFSSASSFSEEAQGAPVASQYISRRSSSGWSTEDVTLPTQSGAYGEGPAGVPYRLFSGDLARALILNGSGCFESESCPRRYTLRQSAGGELTPSPEAPDLRLAGSSPDLRHAVFSTCVALSANATEVPDGKGGCEANATNLYEWSGSQLTLVNLLAGESKSTPGAILAAPGGAVSTDGSRVYFTIDEDGPLNLFEAGKPTKLIPETVGGGASFQTASPDGALAFFTTAASHLYRYEAAADTATDLTPGGEVLGVLGAAENGSRVYYLTAAGLYMRNGATTTQIAAAADTRNFPPATGAARVSPDGTVLAFVSSAPLTGYDNTDRNTGKPDSEVFLYDATANGGAGQLICASCNPEGVAPIGPSAIPGAIANGTGPDATQAYKPRVLTNGGNRLFFDSEDALVPQDTNNERDVYEWEAQGAGSCIQAGGCLQLISSGRSEDGASFVDASEDGRDTFFLTDGSLVPGDPGAVDLYDAREGGGFPVPPKPIPCEGDACQPLPSPPEDPTPGTLVLTEGNPPVRFPKVQKPGGKKHKAKKHHKGKRKTRKHHHQGGHK
jgi:hypothetical protein